MCWDGRFFLGDGRRRFRHHILHDGNADKYQQEDQEKAFLRAGFVLWIAIFRHAAGWQKVCGDGGTRLLDRGRIRRALRGSEPDRNRQSRRAGSARGAKWPNLSRAVRHSALRLRSRIRNRSARSGTRAGAEGKTPIYIPEASLKERFSQSDSSAFLYRAASRDNDRSIT